MCERSHAFACAFAVSGHAARRHCRADVATRSLTLVSTRTRSHTFAFTLARVMRAFARRSAADAAPRTHACVRRVHFITHVNTHVTICTHTSANECDTSRTLAAGTTTAATTATATGTTAAAGASCGFGATAAGATGSFGASGFGAAFAGFVAFGV